MRPRQYLFFWFVSHRCGRLRRRWLLNRFHWWLCWWNDLYHWFSSFSWFLSFGTRLGQLYSRFGRTHNWFGRTDDGLRGWLSCRLGRAELQCHWLWWLDSRLGWYGSWLWSYRCWFRWRLHHWRCGCWCRLCCWCRDTLSRNGSRRQLQQQQTTVLSMSYVSAGGISKQGWLSKV